MYAKPSETLEQQTTSFWRMRLRTLFFYSALVGLIAYGLLTSRGVPRPSILAFVAAGVTAYFGYHRQKAEAPVDHAWDNLDGARVIEYCLAELTGRGYVVAAQTEEFLRMRPAQVVSECARESARRGSTQPLEPAPGLDVIAAATGGGEVHLIGPRRTVEEMRARLDELSERARSGQPHIVGAWGEETGARVPTSFMEQPPGQEGDILGCEPADRRAGGLL
jgi:hypothetical protein